jgi:hypothetical protein
MKVGRLSKRSSKYKLMGVRTLVSPYREYSVASQNKVNEKEE